MSTAHPDGVRTTAMLAVGVVVALELLALGAYLAVAGVGVRAPRYLLYPLVWISLGVLAVAMTRPAARPLRVRALAGGIAGAYLLALLVLDGSLGLAHAGAGLRVVALPPGWGPALVGTVAGVQLALFPFELVGYAALAYLLYDAVLDATAGALGGTLGLVSCVGCAAPGVAGIVAAVAGGSTGAAVAGVATSLSYDLSTLVFVATLAVLSYRPADGPPLLAPDDGEH